MIGNYLFEPVWPGFPTKDEVGLSSEVFYGTELTGSDIR